jgi:hypothetical protein
MAAVALPSMVQGSVLVDPPELPIAADGVVATMFMLGVVGAAVLPSVVQRPVLVVPPALPVDVDGVVVKW